MQARINNTFKQLVSGNTVINEQLFSKKLITDEYFVEKYLTLKDQIRRV